MSKGGVTLVELLAVIAIMAALSVVAWPGYSKIHQRALVQEQVEQVAGLLRTAQERTLAEQAVYAVKFDLAAQTAQLISYGLTYTGQTEYAELDKVTLPTDRVVMQSVSFTNEHNEKIVRFNSAGVPSQPGIVVMKNKIGVAVLWQIEVIAAGSVKVTKL